LGAFSYRQPAASIGSVLTASVTQPLLRGAGRRIAQENLTQAERNVLYQIRSFNRYRQLFVVTIVNDYYRVLQQRDTVTNAENNYKGVLNQDSVWKWRPMPAAQIASKLTSETE